MITDKIKSIQIHNYLQTPIEKIVTKIILESQNEIINELEKIIENGIIRKLGYIPDKNLVNDAIHNLISNQIHLCLNKLKNQSTEAVNTRMILNKFENEIIKKIKNIIAVNLQNKMITQLEKEMDIIE